MMRIIREAHGQFKPYPPIQSGELAAIGALANEDASRDETYEFAGLCQEPKMLRFGGHVQLWFNGVGDDRAVSLIEVNGEEIDEPEDLLAEVNLVVGDFAVARNGHTKRTFEGFVDCYGDDESEPDRARIYVTGGEAVWVEPEITWPVPEPRGAS